MKKSFLVGLLLLAFFFLNLFSALNESLTYDEPIHLQAGLAAWQEKNFSLDTNNPPLVREIATLPFLLGFKGFSSFPSLNYLPGRLMVTALALILAFLVFWFTQVNFSFKAALLALFFFVFEPNVLTHSHYLALDLGTALFFFLAFVSWLRFLESQKLKETLLWGISFGLALAARGLIVLPLGLSFLLSSWFKKEFFLKSSFKKVALGLGIAFLVLWATYFFTLAPVIAYRADPNRLSEKTMVWAQERGLTGVKKLITFGQNTRLPLGYYLATIKNGLVLNLRPQPAFFLGKFFPSNRFYFLPLVFLLKTPLPLLILLAFFLIERKKDQRLLFMILPVAMLLFFLSLGKILPRLRYFLPAYPFLVILAGVQGEKLWQKGRVYRAFLALLLVWYLFFNLLAFPHFLSYTNELVSPIKQKNFLFIDSNFDWGQSLLDLKNYLSRQKIKTLSLSYFGTDDPNSYGLKLDRPWTEKFEERCPFYQVQLQDSGRKIEAISLSNYYYCDYFREEEYNRSQIEEIVGQTILIFK